VKDYNAAQPLKSLSSFSSPVKENSDPESFSYKINITQHVANILENDADRVRLGLVLVDNINNVAIEDDNGNIFAYQVGVKDVDSVETLPAETVLTPEGTVLHGNLSSDEEKRLKLRIYYTETE
jgi:hypothetical protein